jgi:hypothetical protein
MSKPIDQIVAKHLEYFGYENHVQPDGWTYAVHPVRHNIHLRAFELGVRLHCLIWIGNDVSSREAWLDFVNRANESSAVARFTFGRDAEGTWFVRIRALLSGVYDRRLFGLLLDAWHEDLAVLRTASREEETRDEAEEEKHEERAVAH